MGNGWSTVAIREVASPIQRPEKPIPGREYRQIGVRLWGDGTYERELLDGAATQYSVLHRVEADDIIVNKIWARHGSVSVVPPNLAGCYCSGEFPLFRPDETKISPRWVYWMTKTRWFWRACEIASRGTTSKSRIRPEAFASITIPLPDRDQQCRIVAKLDALVAKIEEARKNKHEIEQEAEAMLHSAYAQIVNGAPLHKMDDIAPLIRREVEVRMGEEYPELGIRSFGKGTFHKPALDYLSVGTKRLYRIEPGDLLFSNVFAWEGAIAVAQPEDEGRFGSHRFITCVPKQHVVTAEFLRFYFLTDEGLRKIGEASPGGAGRNRTLGLAKLAEIEVPVPAYEKQVWFNRLQAKVREQRHAPIGLGQGVQRRAITMAHKRAKKQGEKREYKMTVAGQLFKHLGLQMYSGAVPAISELISNAYDAMARNVWITTPTGRPIQQTDEVVVKDDGYGMSFEECNSLYLSVGRNRRSNGSEWTKTYNGLKPRKVQGRKGIGKLAGFGIADRIDIRTVKSNQVAHFVLDFVALTKSPSFADTQGYTPEALADDGASTRDKPGTTVTLSQLKISRAIDEEQFKRGLARRLLVLDKNFTVHVNGKAISRQEIPFQFRFPVKPGKWETADLGNGQEIQWWAGFCKDTIPDEEQRGFVVYVRGKLAQTPWFFDLSGGVWGQHGMQYLTGEVKADFLDESVDLIATDRGTIRWEDPMAVPLKEWGRKKIRELLESWTDKRREAKAKSPKIIQYLEQAEKLPERERKIFKAVVDRICAIPQLDKDKEGKDIADELVEFAYNAMTNRSFLDAIRRLNAASTEDVAQFSEILSEWDIIEAVNTAHLVKGRVEIIRKFKQMIDDKVPEKPDMQDYLRDHPWLIDPKWTTLVHEQSLDSLIVEKFKLAKSGSKEGSRRLDFFCLGDRYKTTHVVETKRPGDLVGRKEFDQLRDYVLFLRQKLQDEVLNEDHKRTTIQGLLIGDRIRPDDQTHAQTHQTSGVFDIRPWGNLLLAAETLHKEFLDIVKGRAPADDPRMKTLSENISENSSSLVRQKRKPSKKGRTAKKKIERKKK